MVDSQLHSPAASPSPFNRTPLPPNSRGLEPCCCSFRAQYEKSGLGARRPRLDPTAADRPAQI